MRSPLRVLGPLAVCLPLIACGSDGDAGTSGQGGGSGSATGGKAGANMGGAAGLSGSSGQSGAGTAGTLGGIDGCGSTDCTVLACGSPCVRNPSPDPPLCAGGVDVGKCDSQGKCIPDTSPQAPVVCGTAGQGGTSAGGSSAGGTDGGGANAGGSSAGSPDAGGANAGGASAGAGGAGLGGQAAFCAGKGSTIPVPGQDTCTGDLGKKTFLFSLCSCSSVTSNNTIKTDSIDSQLGQSTGKNGSVGIVGNFQGQQSSIGGSLWVDGNITTFNQNTVAVDLQCGGTLTTNSSPFAVGGEAYVEGDVVKADGKVTVGKKLHIPAGKSSAGVVGQIVNEPVAVQAPCDCNDTLDIAAIVAAGSSESDNVASQVSAAEFTGLTSPKERSLPCGRFVLDGISSTSSVTIRLTGRTALFIKGDVHVAGPLAFTLDPGAELDLFIDGNLLPDNQLAIGDTMRPAATRVYVSGQAKLPGQLTIGANLYLPNAQVESNNTVEMWGALYAKGLTLAGAFTVHYDEAILEVPGCDGGASGAAGTSGAGGTSAGSAGAAGGSGDECTSCKQCDGATPACKGGECKPCETSADCCPPLVCYGGLCIVPGGKP